MDKRGQQMPSGTSSKTSPGIVRIVGILLILTFLPSILNYLTSWTFRIIFLAIGGVFLYLSFKQQNSFVKLISILLIAFVVLTWFFSPVLDLAERLSGIFAEKYISALILFASGILLLIFGSVIYKFLGVLLFFTGVINISETLIDFNDIFSFLTPFTEYTSNSVFSIFVLIVGIFCLTIGKSGSVLGGAKKFGAGIYPHTTAGQKEMLKARVQAEHFAKKELDAMADNARRHAGTGDERRLIDEWNKKLLEYQKQGLLQNWSFWK